MSFDSVYMNKIPCVLRGAGTYEKWSNAMMPYLMMQGVWRIVSGERTKPIVPRATRATSSPSDTAATDTAAQEEAEEELQEWRILNDKAVGTICLSLAPEILHEVIKIEDARQLWNHLKNRYNVVAEVPPLEGLQTAICTRYDDCSNVQDYIFKMSSALRKFEASLKKGDRLPESMKIQFLLCNLGQTWSTFLSVYINCRFNKETATFIEVSRILIQEEMRVNSMKSRRT